VSPRPLMIASLVSAGVGLTLLLVGLVIDAPRACFSYLDAWTFGATVCIGALLLLMAGHAAKAGWMVIIRRITEAIVDALPLFFVLFVPLCFALPQVYPWAAPASALDPALAQAIARKRIYLNAPFFVARTVLYFAVFVTVGRLLCAWSRANDDAPSMRLVRRMRGLSGGALPLVGLTLTWASFDWTMSLEPDWHSTIYGLYVFAGCFVAALSLVAVMLNGSRARRFSRGHVTVTPDHAQALGRLLFAMIVFWAYMAFSQLLIYWIADIPEEVRYYGLRTTGTWSAVTYGLVFGHFVVPFFLLLNRRWKRHPSYLASIGAWMLLMHFMDVYWLILPVHDRAGVRPHWLDLAAILFVGGASSAWILRRYMTAPPLPLHAPDLAEGLTYEASV
jgi:hypothetical protein